MFYMDGYVCGNDQRPPIKVIDSKTLPGRVLLLTFNNGEQRVFDASVLSGPAFDPLKDAAVFAQSTIDHGVVTWLDGKIDCSPEYMYFNSRIYNE